MVVSEREFKEYSCFATFIQIPPALIILGKISGIVWPFQPLLGLYLFFVVHILQMCIPGVGCVKGA